MLNINPKKNIVPSPMFLQPKTIRSLLKKNPSKSKYFFITFTKFNKMTPKLTPTHILPNAHTRRFFQMS